MWLTCGSGAVDPFVNLTHSTPTDSKPTMADDAHDPSCGCFKLGASYAPLTPETEPNSRRVLTVQQDAKPLTLAFSDASFTVTSVKPDGTGSLDVRNPFLSY